LANGNPDRKAHQEEIDHYDKFFEPISSLLQSIARRHNLYLEKYYHDAPCWSLHFAHPNGGCATVDITQTLNNAVRITGTWWVDEYETFTRFIHTTSAVECPCASDSVEPLVNKALAESYAFVRGKWSSIHPGYEPYWSKTWTKEEFDKLQEPSARFPTPSF
jgi:hypothetical protein